MEGEKGYMMTGRSSLECKENKNEEKKLKKEKRKQTINKVWKWWLLKYICQKMFREQ